MNSLDKLIDITKKLRSEDGCPWDKKLTLKDLKSYILEEAYEIIDALEKNDKDNIKEEAGDLLLQIIFISNICEENKDFNFSDVILQLSDKLIRRHPHVFGNKIADTAEDAKEIWDYQKKSEKTKGKLNSDTPNIRAIKISKEYAQKGLEFSSSNDILNKLIEEIRNEVGKNKVICALSGGVDSSVVAQLINKAIGKKLYCIFVNTGLLRKNEEKQVVNTFKKRLKINLIYVNAEKEFLRKLKNISDPEKKRKIIGNLFIEIFERYAKKIKNVKFLAQGTLYPDLIESKSVTGSQTSKIKSHHNVGGLPKKMKLKLVEPLKFLFKDEVRKLGLELNLSKEIISRHPFPGPGLAIRMPGIITKEKINILKEADHYFIQALRDHNLYHKIWQAYAALLPVKTVGVMGDNRTYEYLCLLRAITSEDGMTADFYEFKKSFIQEISNKIVNSIRGINRVVYDITSKPPSTIELE